MQLAADAVVLVLDPDRRAEAGHDLRRVLGRAGEHELERVEQRERGVLQPVVPGERGGPPDVAVEHPGPLHHVERTVERLGDRGLQETLAATDAELAGEDLHEVLGGEWRRPREQLGEQRGLRRRALGIGDRRVGHGHLGQRRLVRRVDGPIGALEDVLDREPQIGVPVVGLAEGAGGGVGELRDRGGDRRPAQTHRPLVRLRERAAGEEHGRDRQLLGAQGTEIVREEGRLLGRPRRGGHPLGHLAPAAHGSRW